MKTVTIRLSEESHEKGKDNAKKKTRGNFSAYVELLIEEDNKK